MSFSERAIASIRSIRGRSPAAPVSEVALAELEGFLGATLPSDYRAFLAEVADGLDVPGFPQLFAVSRVRAHVAAAGMQPAAPFTYADATVAEMVAILERHGPATVEARAALAPLQHGKTLDGCVPIADGDGDTVVLVVTGGSRGLLFRHGRIDLPEHPRLYRPEDERAGEPLDFMSWLPLWLETMVASVDLAL